MIDISEILVVPEKEHLPLNTLRGMREGSVFLEIGFGNGEFLVHLARENPQKIFVGVEMSRSCVLRACKRIGNEKLANAFLLCGDARFILKKCVPERSLNGIYMNFPCPWPKKKHSKRRVSSGEFSAEIATVLKTGGFFELVTDEEWYGVEVRDALSGHPDLECAEWTINPPRNVTTKYERKWVEMGKTIFLSKFVKKEESSGNVPAFMGRAEDVHVRVFGKGPLGSFVEKLYDQGEKTGEGFWVYKKAYASGDGVYLVETVATDGAFEQKFFLQIVERHEDVLIKVAPYSAPFLTPSVKKSIEGLSERLGVYFQSLGVSKKEVEKII